MTAIATCSYRNFRPSLGVAVQTSRGRPRFPLDYDLVEQIPELAPGGAIFKLEGDEFIVRYREQLDALDLDALRAKFDNIAQRNEGKRVVLLCFEDVQAGELCHRRVFADWFRERTRERIPEVGGRGVIHVGSHEDYDGVVRPG